MSIFVILIVSVISKPFLQPYHLVHCRPSRLTTLQTYNFYFVLSRYLYKNF